MDNFINAHLTKGQSRSLSSSFTPKEAHSSARSTSCAFAQVCVVSLSETILFALPNIN